MKRPSLTLTHLTNADLRAGLIQIQNSDEIWLNKQFEKYNIRNLEYRDRLDWSSKRYDFQKEILSRLDKFNWIPISSAIDIIFEMYQFNIDPSKCHFSIEYCGLAYPKFHFHNPKIENQQIINTKQ